MQRRNGHRVIRHNFHSVTEHSYNAPNPISCWHLYIETHICAFVCARVRVYVRMISARACVCLYIFRFFNGNNLYKRKYSTGKYRES